MKWTTLLAVLGLVSSCSARYASAREDDTGFTPSKLAQPFKSDEEIINYLKERNTDIKLWKCDNGVPITYSKFIAPFELRCEILGQVKSIEFRHNGELMDMGSSKYKLTAFPKATDEQNYMSKWLLYKVKVDEVELSDRGFYSIKVTGASGITEQQLMFVSIKHLDNVVRLGEYPNRSKNNRRGRDRGLTKEERREKRRREREREKRRRRNDRKKRKNRRKNRLNWQTIFL